VYIRGVHTVVCSSVLIIAHKDPFTSCGHELVLSSWERGSNDIGNDFTALGLDMIMYL
jgi:hypothetical protein